MTCFRGSEPDRDNKREASVSKVVLVRAVSTLAPTSVAVSSLSTLDQNCNKALFLPSNSDDMGTCSITGQCRRRPRSVAAAAAPLYACGSPAGQGQSCAFTGTVVRGAGTGRIDG